jgi:hypothetical protein
MKREELQLMPRYNDISNNVFINTLSEEKKDIVKNLYISGIAEEFIALQLDLEIPIVIAVLKELDFYQVSSSD